MEKVLLALVILTMIGGIASAYEQIPPVVVKVIDVWNIADINVLKPDRTEEVIGSLSFVIYGVGFDKEGNEIPAEPIPANAVNVIYTPGVPDNPDTPENEYQRGNWTFNLIDEVTLIIMTGVVKKIEYYILGDGKVDILDLAVASKAYGSVALVINGNDPSTYPSNFSCRFSDVKGEIFSDNIHDNGLWDPAEPYEDSNRNGKYDAGEVFTDIGNSRWDPGEPYVDGSNGQSLNGVYDTHESFTDIGNGVWDPAEPYVDANGNGQYDVDGIADTWLGNPVGMGWFPIDPHGDGVPDLTFVNPRFFSHAYTRIIDTDQDGIKETLVLVSIHWNPLADVNKDTKVDIRDLAIISKHFGEIK